MPSRNLSLPFYVPHIYPQHIPAVTAALNDAPWRIRLVPLHTGTHSGWDTLALVVLHQSWWTLAPWNTHPDVQPSAAVVTAPALLQVRAQTPAGTATLVVHLTPRTRHRWGDTSIMSVHSAQGDRQINEQWIRFRSPSKGSLLITLLCWHGNSYFIFTFYTWIVVLYFIFEFYTLCSKVFHC